MPTSVAPLFVLAREYTRSGHDLPVGVRYTHYNEEKSDSDLSDNQHIKQASCFKNRQNTPNDS